MENENIPNEHKHCYKCGQTKPRTEFYKNKSKYDGLQSACKSCVQAIDAKRFGTKSPVKHITHTVTKESSNPPRTCITCKYGVKDKDSVFRQCHFNPPTYVGFPIVYDTWWCSQHLLKPL